MPKHTKFTVVEEKVSQEDGGGGEKTIRQGAKRMD